MKNWAVWLLYNIETDQNSKKNGHRRDYWQRENSKKNRTYKLNKTARQKATVEAEKKREGEKDRPKPALVRTFSGSDRVSGFLSKFRGIQQLTRWTKQRQKQQQQQKSSAISATCTSQSSDRLRHLPACAETDTTMASNAMARSGFGCRTENAISRELGWAPGSLSRRFQESAFFAVPWENMEAIFYLSVGKDQFISIFLY